MHTVKASNFLAHSEIEFSFQHVLVAKKIHNGIEEKKWEEIGSILKSLPESEKEMVHYAFFDLFGFDYDLKIRRELGGFEGLRKNGIL